MIVWSSLINESSRIKTGSSWSSEQNIVSGERINHQQLRLSLNNQNFSLFIVENFENKNHDLVACIGLTVYDNSVEIGTFCVNSYWQNKGIASKF